MQALNIEEIYKNYFDRVYSYVLRRIMNVERAEDITAGVFMKVLKNLHTYNRNKAALGTWIFTIANNEIINWYRQKKPLSLVEKHDFLLKSDDVLQEVHEIQEALEAEDTWNKVIAVMNDKLDDEEKDLLIGVYFDDLTYRELAEIKKENASTLRSKVHRALKKIRKDVIFEEER
ncbi:MAG TPA: RNA polymerase sigma factor [Candidatus Mcinerneyibacteriales bacterium]|nr:RNA polymerase sigma factor [Candidatus Mcinerneyibacteriales bacterium]HPE21376.1 RNA polymerase sigma factor [Candidatus Mcinerneyibacteriales bacterium]